MAWLGTYKYRMKFKFPAAIVGATQTNFPVSIEFGIAAGIDERDSTFIFEVVSDNYKKIALTDSDGTTRLYGEVEKWDETTPNGLIHIKVPSITTAEKFIYVYFDDEQADDTTYIGLVKSVGALNAWNSTYEIVLNMATDDPETDLPDSTGTYLTGTAGGWTAEGNIVDGNIGKAAFFDGISDVAAVGSGVMSPFAEGTLEMYVSVDPETERGRPFWTTTTAPDDQEFRWIEYYENEWRVGQTPVLTDPLTWNEVDGDAGANSQLYETWQCIQVVTESTLTTLYVDGEVHTGMPFFRIYSDKRLGYGVRTYVSGGGFVNEEFYSRMKVQSFRFLQDPMDINFLNASRLNFTGELVRLEAIEFYENVVNGTPFDIVGDLSGPVTFYLLAVHDSEPDLQVPISSYQFRHSSGAEAYLSVVVPDFDTYYQELLDRDGGQLRLHMLTGAMSDFERDNMIVQVDLDADNIKYDEGTGSKPVSVEGYGVFGSRYLALDLPYNTYKNYENESGEWRFRFPRPFYFVRTNDTVTVDGTEITILDMSGSGPGGQLEISDG